MAETGPLVKAAVVCEKVIEGKDGVLSLIRVVDRYIITAPPGAAPEMPKVPYNFALVLMFTSGELRGMAEVNVALDGCATSDTDAERF